MIAGLVVLTHSPDEESVADAVITLRNMMCDSGISTCELGSVNYVCMAIVLCPSADVVR
jgi:hypothetical protein